MSVCIDYGCLINFCDAFGPHVVQMYVSVHEIRRLEFINEPVKAVKPFVARIFLIVDMTGRGMGKQYVEVSSVADLVVDERGHHAQKAAFHLPVRILIKSVVVSDRPRNTGYEQRRYFPRCRIFERKIAVPDNAESCIESSVSARH